MSAAEMSLIVFRFSELMANGRKKYIIAREGSVRIQFDGRLFGAL
jgi:hypothetical protein